MVVDEEEDDADENIGDKEVQPGGGGCDIFFFKVFLPLCYIIFEKEEETRL